ncbi:MAG: sugar transferase [Acidimicrobiales bacterium]
MTFDSTIARGHVEESVATAPTARFVEPNGDEFHHLARRGPRIRMSKALIATGDVVTIVFAMLLATFVKVHYVTLDPTPLGDYLIAAVVTIPGWIVALRGRRLYEARFISRRAEEVRRIIDACALAVVGLIVADFVLQLAVARTWVGLVGVFSVVSITVYRETVRQVFRARRRRGVGMRRVVIVGDNAEALAIEQLLRDDPSIGYDVAARVVQRSGTQQDEIGHLLLDDTMRAVRDTGAHGVVIAASAVDAKTSNRLVRSLAYSGLHLELSSTLSDISADRLTMHTMGRFPVVYIEPVRRFGWRPVAKRVFDIVGSLALLLAAAPFMLVIAAAIKLSSRGPVLFSQERLGRHGSHFRIYKFRTMVTDAEERLTELRQQNEADGPLFKMTHDPRITRVGGFLRSSSLDELPQLWNVLRGEMSLIGPRPALPSESKEWSLDLFDRLRVRPGMTGMWQVSGRSESSFDEYSRLDLFYVDNWSLVIDMTILVKTIPAVLARRGAR